MKLGAFKFCVTFLLLVGFSGCGGSGGGASGTTPAATLATISMTSSSTGIVVGNTQQFTASGILTDGKAAMLGTLTWSSSNPSVSTINSSGLAVGVSAGSTIISVSNGAITSNSAVLMVTTPSLVGAQMGGARQGTALNLTASVTTLAVSVAAGSVNTPQGITTDGNNLYVTDIYRIRKIDLSTGVETTLAGSGTAGSLDGTGTSASFGTSMDITTDGSNLYIADSANSKIRKLEIATGIVTTFAGSGSAGALDGTGTSAMFSYPDGITTDGINLYVADGGNSLIRKIVIATGAVTTLAGSGSQSAIDGTGTAATFYGPGGITTDGTNLYVADTYNNKIRKIVIATRVVTTLAGSGTASALDGTGTAASFWDPRGITTDGTNLYVTDFANDKIRKIVIATGVVTTLAGSGTNGSLDGTGTAASFNYLCGITTDGTSLYIADSNNHKIRKIQ